MRRIIILLSIVPAFAWQSSTAAELRLRQQCSPRTAVVTLGEVAEIYAADQQQGAKLAAMELFPAPPEGQQRVIRVRELQDLLILRGVNLTEHRFSGSSQVVVTSVNASSPADGDQALPLSAVKRAQRRIQDAILQYLRVKSASQGPRILQFEPTAALTHAAANTAQAITVSGGTAPWTGNQRFDLTVDASEGPAHFTLDVQVTVPSAVVAASHSLSRGAVIRESDLVLINEMPREGQSGVFHAIEDIVGKETACAIADGKILAPDDVQAPLLVHRGDVVTVYARCAGIRVRTTARAREDGSLGALVTLETMHDRKTYQARVCAVREAEVFAQAVPAK
jgi:flagella basal body P-ring formation protein FlgA